MKNILFIISFLFSCFSLNAKQTISKELKFCDYLLKKYEFEDALIVLHKLETNNTQQRDSINYFIGWSYYSLKKLDSASTFFDKVSQEFNDYEKAVYFNVFCNAYIGNLYKADTLLKKIQATNKNLLYFLQAETALLQRDYEKFFIAKKNIREVTYHFEKEVNYLDDHYNQLLKIKNKSPFLASLYSSLIPGLGKFYAGYRGKALSTFVQVSMISAVAVENVLKAGVVSPQFALFGGVASVFYLGNIYGSAFSTKIRKEEKTHEVEHAILFDMHIVLRRFYIS